MSIRAPTAIEISFPPATSPLPSSALSPTASFKVSTPIELRNPSLWRNHNRGKSPGLRVFSPVCSSPVAEEPVVLCEDTIMNITSFMDVQTALTFRLVSAQSNAIVTDFTPYWQYQAKQMFEQEIPSSSNSLADFLTLCKKCRMVKEKQRFNVKCVEAVDPVQKLLRLMYAGACPVMFSVGLVILSILWPLMMDEHIRSDPETIRYLFIPMIILVIVPYLLMALGITFDSFVVYKLKALFINNGLPEGNDKKKTFFEHDKLRDIRLRHSVTIFIWGIAGIPLQITSFFIRYSLPNKYKLSYFCYPQYLFTIVYAVVPLISYLFIYRASRGAEIATKCRMMALPVFVHLNFVVMNIMLSAQIALICLKIDGMISASYLTLCVPLWVYAVTLGVFAIILSLILWSGNHKRSISSIVTFIATLIAVLVAIFFSVSAVVLALRLDGSFLTAYFIISIPMFFGVMVFLPVTCLSSLLCCLYTVTGPAEKV